MLGIKIKGSVKFMSDDILKIIKKQDFDLEIVEDGMGNIENHAQILRPFEAQHPLN